MDKQERLAWLLRAAPLVFGEHWTAEVARRARLSRRAVERWRKGDRWPKQQVIERLALLLMQRRNELLRAAREAPVEEGSPTWHQIFQAPGGGDAAALMDQLPASEAAVGSVDPFSMSDAELEQRIQAVAALRPMPEPKPEPAPPAERPKRRGRPPAVTEENIAKELGARGIRVFLAPPPRFNLTREQAAQERLDHAAGKVVYWSELMQHAHILQE